MALSFAAIMSHSPLLVPNIGKENTAKLAVTLENSKNLYQKFIDHQIDIIIIISSKGHINPGGLTINTSPKFKANLEMFGDLVTYWEFNGEMDLVGRLREKFDGKINLNLITDSELDYGSAIPLALLNNQLKQLILPLTIDPNLSLTEIIDLGKDLQSFIVNDQAHIAIIASADLSHRLSKKSSNGYSPKSKKFDQKLIEILKTKDQKSLVELNYLANEVACEDLASLALFLGLLDDVGLEAKLLSYEAPFGVGHCLIQYDQPNYSSLT